MSNSDPLIFWSLFFLGKEPVGFPTCLQSPKGSERLASLPSPSKPGFSIAETSVFMSHSSVLPWRIENPVAGRRAQDSVSCLRPSLLRRAPHTGRLGRTQCCEVTGGVTVPGFRADSVFQGRETTLSRHRRRGPASASASPRPTARRARSRAPSTQDSARGRRLRSAGTRSRTWVRLGLSRR